MWNMRALPTVTVAPCLSTLCPMGLHQQMKARVQTRSDQVIRQSKRLSLRLASQRKAGVISRADVSARGAFQNQCGRFLPSKGSGPIYLTNTL